MTATIMVVDDSQMVRRQVGQALEGAGFITLEARDGLDALDKLSTPGLALIVLDVNMPNMGGLDFLQDLRTRPKYANVPVVMLTTEGQPQLMKQAKALGARGWIVKPFKPDMLIAAVQRLVDAAAMR